MLARIKIRDRPLTPGCAHYRLEREQGIVVRFVVGHSVDQTLERGMAAEEAAHRDFLRLPFQVLCARSVPVSMASARSAMACHTYVRTRVAQSLMVQSPVYPPART